MSSAGRQIAATVLCGAIVASASANTVYVDDDAPIGGDGLNWTTAYADLQDGLAVAAIGDEIHVAGGCYKPDQDEAGNVVPGDRGATFRLISGVALYGGYAGIGAPDPDQRDLVLHETILSGDLNGDDGPDFANADENSYHVVTGSATDATAILDGFTITAGNADGGGLRSAGGGMFTNGGSPTVSNCTFTLNMAEFGAGMDNESSSPTLIGCTFGDNHVVWYGGGMYNYESNPVLIECDFWGNHAAAEGGAMRNWYGEVTMIKCRFGGNSAVEFGGAMASASGTVNVVDSTFSGNVAGIGGGAIADFYQAENSYTNCTFTRNRGEYGGAVDIGASTGTTLSNCIIWGNVGGGLPGESAQIDDSHGGVLQVANSCVQGLDVYTGAGNIGADPLFTNADGHDGIAGTEDDDLSLRPGSPCVDAGDNGRLPADIFDLDADGDTTEPMPVDLSGGSRFLDDPCTDDTGVPHPGFPSLAIVDMGAHERPDDSADDPDGDGIINCDDNCPVNHNPGQEDCAGDGVGDLCTIVQCNAQPYCEDCDANGRPDVCDLAGGHLIDEDGNGRPDQCQRPIYVDDDAQLGGDGISWTTAYRYLQDALAAARAGDEIRVAAGTYHPDRDEAGNVTPFDRTATFRLANERTVRGGFRGCPGGPCDLQEASWRDIAAYETVLSGDLAGDDGPGFENNDENSYHIVTASGTDATAVLDGLTITRGYTDSVFPNNDGAGIYTLEGSPYVSHCTFTWNSAETGAAMSNHDSSPTIVGCTFIRNTTLHQGGAIENAWGGSPKVSRCTFIANSATGLSYGEGGAINSVGCTPVITDCLFIGNSARRHGGAVRHMGTQEAIVANCTFVANSASMQGGGIHNYWNSDPTVTNCILWGDSPDEIYNDDPTEDRPTVRYSNVQGGLGTGTINGGGNIDTDPQFVRNPDDGGDGWGDDPDTTEIDESANDDFGDLRLQVGSLCRNAGDPGFMPKPGETDLDGNARVLCGRVDMGAYESGIGDYDCSDAVDLLDFSSWAGCMTGPGGGPIGEGCEAFDFDSDDDVDTADFGGYLQVFGSEP